MPFCKANHADPGLSRAFLFFCFLSSVCPVLILTFDPYWSCSLFNIFTFSELTRLLETEAMNCSIATFFLISFDFIFLWSGLGLNLSHQQVLTCAAAVDHVYVNHLSFIKTLPKRLATSLAKYKL